ncbi:MAG: glycosyl hydrolase, partial [Thermoguttaceae bacterium]
ADGRLAWKVPAGEWTILRLGRTATGQVTRPAPMPGLGFESDKFSPAAIDAHLDAFVGTLLKSIGPRAVEGAGLTGLHFDSWEMGSQNWSEKFRDEFRSRRGYDPLPYLPAMTRRVVGSTEVSERFLWDLRRTAQELTVANHIARLRDYSHRHDLKLSIEPYDLNPAGDLTLGRLADIPMGEFWAQGHGFDTNYSCIEAVSIGHTCGRPVIAAESFTADDTEAWRLYPGAMKAQADWALATGINRITFHRYEHQPRLDRWPGMTMGPYGVHWERTQTWWDFVPAFHTYLARCQQMLRRGLPVADVLYLAPEGAPHVFRPPASATRGNPPDRLGYNFDGCAPETLIERATVRDGLIAFPDGMTYRVLVLPRFDTMTPALLGKIAALADAGATVLGTPPRKSPSLADYPSCDAEVKRLADRLWGQGLIVVPPSDKRPTSPTDIYPEYGVTAALLAGKGVPADFESERPLRYLHRRDGETDIYFVANSAPTTVEAACTFRVSGKAPEIWNPVTGEMRSAAAFTQPDGRTTVPLRFDPSGSLFVVFRTPTHLTRSEGHNFADFLPLAELTGPWSVRFDPKWGGPGDVRFESLVDWTKRPEDGIRHYSGKAVYKKTMTIPEQPKGRRTFLTLGEVKDLAEVRLNGQRLGVVWCPPWRIEITDAVRPGENELEVTVANQWVNRLIGDAALPPEKRVTWTTWSPYTATSPLQPSGLLGPVRIEYAKPGQ